MATAAQPLRRNTSNVHVVAMNDGVRSERTDTLAAEEPLEIRARCDAERERVGREARAGLRVGGEGASKAERGKGGEEGAPVKHDLENNARACRHEDKKKARRGCIEPWCRGKKISR